VDHDINSRRFLRYVLWATLFRCCWYFDGSESTEIYPQNLNNHKRTSLFLCKNRSQIKFVYPKEKSLTTVNHWKIILFCRRNNNSVSSTKVFILGLHVTSAPFAHNHTVLADILTLNFFVQT